MKKTVKQFVLISTILVLVTTAGSLIGPIEVRFLEKLTSSSVLIGLTYSVGSILLAVLSIYIGRLSDKFGRLRLILLGCGLGIIYPLLYASTYNIFQYMGVKVAWAFTAVAVGPVLMAYLEDLMKSSDKPGQYFSWLFALQAIFGAGASFFGGWLSDRYSLTVPYLVMSLVFLLATIIFFVEIKFRNEIKLPKIKSENKQTTKWHQRFKIIYTKPELKYYLFSKLGIDISWSIRSMLWPLIIFAMVEKDTVTGSIYATMGIVAFLVLLISGKMVDKIGVFKSSFISQIILVVSGLVLALTGNIIIFWVAAAFTAVAEAINGPMREVLLVRFLDNRYRGETLGVFELLGKLIGIIFPFVAGILLNILRAQNVFFVFIIIIIILFSVSLNIFVKKIRKPA